EKLSGVHPRFEDGAAVGGGVAAIDAAAGEGDDDVGGVECDRPGAGRFAVPGESGPGRRAGAAGDDGGLMTALVEVTRDDPSNLPATAWDDDFHCGNLPEGFGSGNGKVSGVTRTAVVNLSGYLPPPGKVSSMKAALQPFSGFSTVASYAPFDFALR